MTDTVSGVPPGPTRITNWYHSMFQILPTFGQLIPKMSSDTSESGRK